MRLAPRGDDVLERVAIRLNLAPLPGALTMYGMPAATRRRRGPEDRRLRRAAREDRRRAGRVAEQLRAAGAAARVCCARTSPASACSTQDGHTFCVAAPHAQVGRPGLARPTSAPGSSTPPATGSGTRDLERIVREGGSFEIHREPAEDAGVLARLHHRPVRARAPLRRRSRQGGRAARRRRGAARRGGRPRLVLGRAVQAPRGPAGDGPRPARERARRARDHRARRA